VARLGEKLLERWANPARRFHGIDHLITVLQKVDELSQEASCPPLVRLAAFYHGAVIPSAVSQAGRHTWGEDEAVSADLAYGQLNHLGLGETKAARVRQLIAGLGSRPPVVKDPDLAVLCDAERAVLASDPRAYRAYSAAIRDEFASSDPAEVLEARIGVLRRWLAKDRLFLTSAAGAWEGAARNNVEAELTRCLGELETLTAGDAEAQPVGSRA
jgi:predicted metal-dependent HD superfamily phosphohydrolase